MNDAISFTVTPNDAALIDKIARRALEMAVKYKVTLDSTMLVMDLTACHCNGNPLKLLQLYMSDETDFSHDILGIATHLNRRNGQLMRNFQLRFAEKKH